MFNRQVVAHNGMLPKIADNVLLADGSRIVGDVTIAEDCSIWFNTVVRGDIARVEIKKGSSIQDNSTIHVGNNFPCIVGENVTAGHNVIIHGCIIGNNSLIGMGAILLNGCEIGENSIVAAGSLVTEGKKFPPRSMIMGSPAKVVRELTDEDIEKKIMRSGEAYRKKRGEYLKEQQESTNK